MSNLNNLTSKILNDAKKQADEIVRSAEEKAKQKYDLEIKKITVKKQSEKGNVIIGVAQIGDRCYAIKINIHLL